MLILVLTLALTALIVFVLAARTHAHTTDLGAMSHQWVAAHLASQPASSN
jgi:hypothetical protein